jgi:AraC family transcriptional regulator of adaptative response/methylated-DNA-[protein]-cysteine methyltransferase
MSMTVDEMWEAVVTRDSSCDGNFFYCVSTTGVYCRPSCGARQPRRKNVRFHRSIGAAEAAGFRPCRRCQPNREPLALRHAAFVERACREIESADRTPSLAALAVSAGLSPYYFQRIFKALTGVTPKGYASAIRERRSRDALIRRSSVTDAIYEAGFGSSSRFYASSQQRLGMAPSKVRAGGVDEVIRFAVGQCSLGAVLVAASAVGICAISLGDDAGVLVRELQDRYPNANLAGDDPAFDQWIAAVIGSIEDPNAGMDLPLDIRGTAFQQRVWKALKQIPIGSTSTYAEVAASIGSPTATRAVAQACAANKIALAIPCHRVIRTDGALSGYRWGVERKREMLAKERE